MKIYYIVNLGSGKSSISSKLGKVIDIFTKSGYETTVYTTQKEADAVEAARNACNSREYNYIVCSGGDGTFSEVINGVLLSYNHLPIGFIPTGSTNDFARGIGIPLSIESAAESFTQGREVRCDVGICNSKTFLYVAAFGAFTDVTYETSQVIKNVLGHAAYIFNGIARLGKYINCSCKMKIDYVSADDTESSITGEFIYGMVTNSASVAGFLSLNNFLYDDGVFEVTLINKPNSLMELNKIVSSLNDISKGADKDVFISFRAKKVVFTVLDDKKVPWTLDGEYGGSENVHTIENRNKAVSLIIKDIPEDKFVSYENYKSKK